jgi:hypothetical protein
MVTATTTTGNIFWTQPLDEEVSASITQTWTDQAIKCYVTNADCGNCSIPRGGYSFVCQMNKVVPVLLKTLGHPDTKRVDKLLPYLSQY